MILQTEKLEISTHCLKRRVLCKLLTASSQEDLLHGKPVDASCFAKCFCNEHYTGISIFQFVFNLHWESPIAKYWSRIRDTAIKDTCKKKIIIKERAVNTGWYFFSKITKVTKRVNFLIWVFPLLGWLPRGGFRFASNEGPYWFSNSTWFTANDRVNKRAKQGYPCFGPCWRYLSRIRW